MKAIIRKIYIKKIETKAGQKFDKICIECDCIGEGNKVKTRTAEMSVDYAKKYFNFCGISSAQAIGMEVDVTMQKRAFNDAQGNLCTFEEIKYMNFLNDDGEPIIIQRKSETPDLPF